MEISITGFKKSAAVEIKEATEFFVDLLFDANVAKNLQLDIERAAKMDFEGECVNEDDTVDPRWFTISLRAGKDDEDPIKTLAHELVHVRQSANNWLEKRTKTTKGKTTIQAVWMGKPWAPSEKEDSYWDSPWELEAFGREVGLYQRWLASRSL